MRVFRLVFGTMAAAGAAAAFSLVSFAATPGEGTLSSRKDEVTWSGGPFSAAGAAVSNPAACSGLAADPTCDRFLLRIDNERLDNILVAIAPADGFETDDYDLFVYDDQGVLVATQADGDGNESVVFANTGASYYEVRVQPWTVGNGSSYNAVATYSRTDPPLDVETDCNEFVPAAAGVDLGQPVELSVMLLLDGVSADVAKALMANAAKSYADHNVQLVLKRTQKVSFLSLTSDALIEDAKTFVGGVRPRGIDVVGVLTTKEMQGGAVPGSIVVGQADCIGGIRYDAHAFFVASDIRDIEVPSGTASGPLYQLGYNQNLGAATEVISHEIGHLMGAHHHYSNCVEGNLQDDGPGDLSPCTLMHPAVNNAGLQFSTLETAVVRGHAVNYAAP